MESTKPKNLGGRPKKTEEISLDKIGEIMLKAAQRGSFFEQLPWEIYNETKVKVSMRWLHTIQDEEFLHTKSVAMAMCSKYWTELMAQAAIPSAVWIFIMKNVAKWNDNKEVKLEVTDKTEPTEGAEEERKARIDLIKRMAKDGK